MEFMSCPLPRCLIRRKFARPFFRFRTRRRTRRTIARLNFLLGELFAEALQKTGVPLETIELIGSHGQTIFHEGEPVEFLGRKDREHHADWRGGGDRRADGHPDHRRF